MEGKWCRKNSQVHLSVLCTKANTFCFNYWLPPGSGLPQPSARSVKFKTLACLCPAFQTWQENSALPNTRVPRALAWARVPAVWGAVTVLLEGWKMCRCSPGCEGLPGCSRQFSAPEVLRAHSCTYRARRFQSAGGDFTGSTGTAPRRAHQQHPCCFFSLSRASPASFLLEFCFWQEWGHLLVVTKMFSSKLIMNIIYNIGQTQAGILPKCLY